MRCPRPIYGRGLPGQRAAVGRRWSTRATILRSRRFRDRQPWRSFSRSGASSGVAHPSPTTPSLLGDRRRGRSMDNPAKRVATPATEPVFVSTWIRCACPERRIPIRSTRADRALCVPIRPAPPPDRSARSGAIRRLAATSAAPPPRARGPDPRNAPAAVTFRASRRTKAPNSPRPGPPAESSSAAAGGACGCSAARTPAPAGPPSAFSSRHGGSAPSAPCPGGRTAGSRTARTGAQALHPVRELDLAASLHDEVGVVVLDRLLDG